MQATDQKSVMKGHMNREPGSNEADLSTRYHRHTLTFVLQILAIVTLSGWLIAQMIGFVVAVRGAAVIIIGAFFFAHVVYPATRRLTVFMPLGAAIALVYIAIAAIVGTLYSTVAPVLGSNLHDFLVNAPRLGAQVQRGTGCPPCQRSSQQCHSSRPCAQQSWAQTSQTQLFY